jgi:ATP-binding cassette subfamily B protein
MGFFDGLEAEPYDRTYRDRDLVRRMADAFRPKGRAIGVILACNLIAAAAGVGVPILMARGVDLMVQAGTPAGMAALAAGLFILGSAGWGVNWIRRRVTARAVGDVMLALRRRAFAAAAEHDLSFYDEHSSGRIVSRITSDTEEFANVVTLVADLMSSFVQAGILLIVLARIEVRLLPWLLVTLPPVFFCAYAFRRLARTVTRRGFRAMANVNALTKEAVSGIAVAKNFRQEGAIFTEFDRVNRQSYAINVRRGFVLGMIFPVLNALAGPGTALLLYAGAVNVAGALITYGSWYLFVTSLDYFWDPMLAFSSYWSRIQGGLSAAERVFALIDAESAVVQSERRAVPVLRGEIRFEHVGFYYKSTEPVLKDFDLLVRPGETLALVGHTGAGKSSIAKLVTRFYEFQSGRLLIDGMDIRTLDLQAYRRQLGIVPQSPFLFSGTVIDNIRYARPVAPLAEIEALARRIGGGEWLESLPEGLATEVGERGARLSMGQRQLVSLMRVLVQKPAIFILDEATANIDPFTEAQIQEALGLILAETTALLIAHRLSTVRAADRILVLRQGVILEEGDHDGLLQRGGHYAELYNTYFRHQALGYVPEGMEIVDGRLSVKGV